MIPQDQVPAEPQTKISFPSPDTISEYAGEQPSVLPPVLPKNNLLKQIFTGPQGIRAGWSIALFLFLAIVLGALFGLAVTFTFKKILHIKTGAGTPLTILIGQIIEVLALVGAATVCARVEGRRLRDYNLTGPNRLRHFMTGLVGGFVALSALVLAMASGGWLHFGPLTLTGAQILQFGSIWGLTFLLTGFGEEGAVRCYLQFNLTRGINLWWALGLVGAMCLSCALFVHNEGAWGVYTMAALGLLPILRLQLSKSTHTAFWQAAWVTSTLFGFMHTGNNGETWVGIFGAAAIGFIFCVSIRLTGSAWWAIGFHATWDWAETFFYGTYDSGLVPVGHYLTTSPAGPPLYSGGTDGPEGSLLILPLILLLLITIVLAYRVKREGLSVRGDIAA